ncbi:hypothetical protein NUU61_002610 [Penicillium alfredii]|uniref:AB hydrolase-1 domain-containing protein n=1 Tax=Penicillium alfredii TaxID=1506179 RepID=A0A9W9FRW2_9EURO|nr:uncharacterized protein NUU61_002610 [Penicillium alfredii]KAJ5105263.1 hypothetical protein NUU61_002610 [Penicillium alfredii]
MLVSGIFLWALTAGAVSAKTCHNITVEVPVTARNGLFDKVQTPKTNSEATAFAISATKQGGNGTQAALSGYHTVSGHYNISAQYCVPKQAKGNGHTLQILTHGIGFDKTYWDLPYNNYNYSYVDHALSRGYHTFSYDRLGIGKSSHGEPKNEIQAFLEIEALAELTRQLRKGTVPQIHEKPAKIVHVGHSFGSTQSYALSAKYPDISDGLVLTGFSTNATYIPYFLAGASFQQARLNRQSPGNLTSRKGLDYSLGYLTSADTSNNEFLFFQPPYFDPGLLLFAEQNKHPVAVGELLTVGSLPMQSKFSGPVLVLTGSSDLPFCGGDCLATGGAAPSIPAEAKLAFPAAKPFAAHIQPNTGHGLNMHYNATAGYKYISDFLGAHGLAAEKK